MSGPEAPAETILITLKLIVKHTQNATFYPWSSIIPYKFNYMSEKRINIHFLFCNWYSNYVLNFCQREFHYKIKRKCVNGNRTPRFQEITTRAFFSTSELQKTFLICTKSSPQSVKFPFDSPPEKKWIIFHLFSSKYLLKSFWHTQ